MKEIQHDSHIHPMLLCEEKKKKAYELEAECSMGGRVIVIGDHYYGCSTVLGCKYYLHKICEEFSLGSKTHHPLHVNHPLTPYLKPPSSPNQNHFVCNFCGKPGSGFNYHCDKCDFYLHVGCSVNFNKKTKLLMQQKYEVQHFLHHDQDHRLIPCLHDQEDQSYHCALCNLDIINTPALECSSSSCKFYLHVPCFKTPEELTHPFHPQHSLTLMKKTPASEKFQCDACLKVFDFALHCSECSFNLCIVCSFLPTVKHHLHKHDVVHFEEIADVVICTACKYPCKEDLFRCFTCNFNAHSGCLQLPSQVTDYHHMHPLTLTTSFHESNSGECYCNVCKQSKDSELGLHYICKECRYAGHVYCVIPHPRELLELDVEIGELHKTVNGIKERLEKELKAPIVDLRAKIKELEDKHP